MSEEEQSLIIIEPEKPDHESPDIEESSSSSSSCRGDCLNLSGDLFFKWFGWISDYSIDYLPKDILGGITVGIVLVPQAIAYSALVNLPAIYGLYTSFFGAIIYSIFGTSRHLSVGPDSTTCILLGQLIAHMAALPQTEVHTEEGQATLLQYSILVTCVTGILLLILGFLNFGFLDSVLSRPVLAGFVCSVGLILIADQSPRLLGLPPDPSLTGTSTSWEKLYFVFTHLEKVNWPTFITSVSSIAFLLIMRVLKTQYPENAKVVCFPDIFVLVVVSTIVSSVFDLSKYGVDVLGEMKAGFLPPAWPRFDEGLGDMGELLSAGISITVLGFTATSVPTKLYANKYNYVVSPNMELGALGLCSLIGSFFGAFPMFGSLVRTRMNEQAGGQTKLVGFIAAALVFSAIAIFLPYFALMPKAVTSAILVSIAVTLISFEELFFVCSLRAYQDACMMLAMILITFLFGIQSGIMFALAACLLVLVQHVNKPAVTVLGRTSTDHSFHDIEHVSFDVELLEGLLIFKIDGYLHFANAEQVRSFARSYEQNRRPSTPVLGVSRLFGARSPYMTNRQKRVSKLSSSTTNSNPQNLSVQYGSTTTNTTSSPSSSPSLSSSSSSSLSSARLLSRHILESNVIINLTKAWKRKNQAQAPAVTLSHVIFDLTYLTSVDASAVRTLMEMISTYNSRNVTVSFVGVREDVQRIFDAAGLTKAVGSRSFLLLRDAVQAAEQSMRR